MKKNKMMRLASAMMVMTLMTTSVISGTFAKYVTSETAADTARVAQWGVEITKTGYLFNDSYLDEPTTYSDSDNDTSITVQALNKNTKVVAPGTQNTNTDALTFAISGQPEVDVNLKFEVTTTDVKDVFLKAATNLPDMTTMADGDVITFDGDKDYYPVKYTLSQSNEANSYTYAPVTVDSKLIENVTLNELVTALNNLTANYDAKEDLAKSIGSYQITWKWDYEGNNAADTFLGNVQADSSVATTLGLSAGTNYNLETAFNVKVTLTQVN